MHGKSVITILFYICIMIISLWIASDRYVGLSSSGVSLTINVLGILYAIVASYVGWRNKNLFKVILYCGLIWLSGDLLFRFNSNGVLDWLLYERLGWSSGDVQKMVAGFAKDWAGWLIGIGSSILIFYIFIIEKSLRTIGHDR